jgi:fermentation-respiration switch protein FrsA (DUF1100 family)
MKEEFVFFLNKNEKIVGMLHIPEKTPAPAIIFCHGFTGNRIESHRLFVHAAREMCKKGFVILRFDFRGSGESDGLFENVTISEEISDLKAAIDWLYNREEILKDKIGVIGLSLGGVIAILTASQDERIKAICTWSTPADLKDPEFQNTAKSIFGEVKIEKIILKEYIDLPSGDRIKRKFLIDAFKHDILKSVEKISPRPILIIHGTKDPLVPISHAEKLFEKAKDPKKKILIENADHTFNKWDWQWQVINYTIEWFEKNLK